MNINTEELLRMFKEKKGHPTCNETMEGLPKNCLLKHVIEDKTEGTEDEEEDIWSHLMT